MIRECFEPEFSSSSRKCISQIINDKQEDEIKIKNLFTDATRLYEICDYKEHYSNYVALVGPAKIGKTTLVTQIFNCFGNSHNYMFYINVNKIFIDDEEIDLLSFLIPHNYLWMQEEKQRKVVLEDIVQNEQKLLFIIDELDVDKFEFQPEPRVFTKGYFRNTTRKLFLSNILCSELFAESKKILVSRSYQYHCLPEIYKPKLLATVSGLSQEKQEKFCENEGCNVENSFKKFQPFPDIHLICSVPFNCKSFIKLFKDPTYNFTNSTALFSVLCKFINCLPKRSNNLTHLTKLIDFAWSRNSQKGLDKYFFGLNELQAQNLDKESIDYFFLLQEWRSPLFGYEDETEFKFCFSSLLLEEFFVALKHISFPPSDLHKTLTEIPKDLCLQADDSCCHVVFMLMFGFCNTWLHGSLKRFQGLTDKQLQTVRICLNNFLHNFTPECQPGNCQSSKLQNCIELYKQEMGEISRGSTNGFQT